MFFVSYASAYIEKKKIILKTIHFLEAGLNFFNNCELNETFSKQYYQNYQFLHPNESRILQNVAFIDAETRSCIANKL